jgi:hypothetical protein
MADTRINALSTATVSLSDDFLPIDGTTAGTKKLSAYNPSFGGNATVGGTLTVNGGTTLNATLVVSSNVGTIGKSGTGTGGNWRFVSDDGTTRWLSGILGGAGETSFSIYDIANSRSLLTATAAGVVQINQTTASTSTSSGALVVGNGTSGGLGVGGAIWGGGKVHVGSAGYADGGAKLNVYATPSDAGYLYGIRLSDNSTATLALGLQTPTGTTSSFIHSNIALGFGTVGVAALNINTSQQVQVLATTASSSTTTGALVVSGGVGVAGSINAGTTGANHSHVFTGGDLGSGSTILVARDSNGTNQFIVGGSGVVQITNSLQLNGSANVLRIVNSQTPASASATGTAGTIAWDSSYIYVCTATNTWKRVAISTW